MNGNIINFLEKIHLTKYFSKTIGPFRVKDVIYKLMQKKGTSAVSRQVLGGAST
jgi:hypothetical protein